MKKHFVLKYLLVALLLGIANTSLRADDQATSEKSGEQKSEELTKKREEFKNLTPEQRAAKRKEMRAKRQKLLAELRKKKTGGTITPQEEKRLARLEAAEKNAAKPNAHPRQKKDNTEQHSGEEKTQ
jgi:hypothetical protein